jgi:hypothetical protein
LQKAADKTASPLQVCSFLIRLPGTALRRGFALIRDLPGKAHFGQSHRQLSALAKSRSHKVRYRSQTALGSSRHVARKNSGC